MLDVIRDALAESLEGEAEQSALDRNAVPSRGVSIPLIGKLVAGREKAARGEITDCNVHETGAPAR